MDAVTDLLAKLPDLVVSFAGMGPWGWVAGGVLALVIGIGAWLIARHIKKKAIEKSNRDTAANRQQNNASLPKDQADWEQGNQSAIDRLRDLIKKRR